MHIAYVYKGCSMELINTALLHLALILITISCTQAIPLEDFYPFGNGTDDAQLPTNDDGFAGPVNLPAPPFPFYDELYESIFVNNNGLLSFLEGVSQYTPDKFPLPDRKLIAPFWADVDTRGTGVVWYRSTTEAALLERFMTEPQIQDGFTPSYLFIATWDHVGYFDSNVNKTNTFQCVLATDGLTSYAVFLYADGEIQWTTGDASGGIDGLNGTEGHAGFNAGDGVNFALLPESDSPEIISVDTTSNVKVPGVWVFQIDSEDVVVEGVCNSIDLQPKAYINPRSGPQQGGTTVIVTGPCFEESYKIICTFGGREVEGIYISEQQALCISPQLPSFGRLTFKLTLQNATDIVVFEGERIFYALDPENENPAVKIVSTESGLPYATPFKVTWNTDEVVPRSLTLASDSFKVNINLYRYIMDTERWEFLEMLREAIDNTGEANVVIRQLSCDACPVAIAVEVSDNSGPISIGRKAISVVDILAGAAKLWSTFTHFVKQTTANVLQDLCQEWCDSQPDNIGQDLLDRLPPCPPTVQRAQLDNRFRLDNRFIETFHPGAENCFRQEDFNENDRGAGQQCCYGRDGSLLVGPRGGGTVDRYAPNSFTGFWKHQFEDVLPFFYCCTFEGTCQEYYQKRPSSDGTGYRLPVPACVYGDPHIVTLDTLKYTFNGKGEFTLIETTDNKFTLQGRMVAAEGDTGASVAATVFSAIVGKQDYSDAVQLELSRRGIDALVNGERVDFEAVSSQDFNNVTVVDLGNNTIAARFSYGAYVEAKEENGIVSVLLVGLPDTFSGETRGLMGNFNGDTSDDLVPKNSNESLPTNSSLQEIHDFGITWIIYYPSDSLFTYKAGESLFTFFDPGFTPAFETVFSDPALETQAMELCNGDEFCLFDIAATGSIDIGLSTLDGSQNFETIMELSLPVVCDPACENGACVANDTCKCSEGYEGEQCTEKVYTECDIKDEDGTEICKNGATCIQHVLTYTCECAEGFTGSNCEEAVPDDTTTYIIIAASSAGGLLLALSCLIITLLVICCCVRGKPMKGRPDKQEFEKQPYPV